MTAKNVTTVIGLFILCLAATAASGEDLRPAMLETHNTHRDRHCVPRLTWSDELARGAQEWANACTPDPDDPKKFAHSKGTGLGENLAWGTPLTGKDAVERWYNEIAKYDFQNPVWSTEVGHFTQMVWRNTTQIGCAVAPCSQQNFYVCRYSPPGNFNVVPNPNLSAERARKNLMDNVPPPTCEAGGSPSTRPGPEGNLRVEVVFEEMLVNECPEVGICDWKLACSLDNQPQTEFFSMAEANTGDHLAINRTLTRGGRLPVRVTCTVHEHDSEFPSFDVWELIGTSFITIDRTSKCVSDPTDTCQININQNRDEGDVTVSLRAEALGTIETGLSMQPQLPPLAPTACRMDSPPNCGFMDIKCDAPLPVADEIVVGGGPGFQIRVFRVVRDIGLINAEYFGEGDAVVVVCARNKGGASCSSRFAATLGPMFCPHPPPPPPVCPSGFRPCPSRGCIRLGEHCDFPQ